MKNEINIDRNTIIAPKVTPLSESKFIADSAGTVRTFRQVSLYKRVLYKIKKILSINTTTKTKDTK